MCHVTTILPSRMSLPLTKDGVRVGTAYITTNPDGSIDAEVKTKLVIPKKENVSIGWSP
jgi:hypothetical protein